jgi:HEAT repeat protein
MPLVKATAAASDTVVAEPRELLLERLSGNDVDERRRAARALSRDPDAASALADRLESEPEPGVRDAIFGSLVIIGGTLAAGLVAPFLRSADANLRGGAVEALKRLVGDAVPVLDALLGDPDPDVRLLVVEVARAWPSELAVPRLRRVIENDLHVNVCGAAVDVATEVGTAELIEPLAGLRARFAGEPFLIFAIDTACSRILAAGERDA